SATARAPARTARAHADPAPEPAGERGRRVIFETRPSSSESAAGTLVLFHGRATDEHDLQPVIDALDPEGRLVGFTPRGPFTMPPGGFHWYGPVVRVGYPNRET